MSNTTNIILKKAKLYARTTVDFKRGTKKRELHVVSKSFTPVQFQNYFGTVVKVMKGVAESC